MAQVNMKEMLDAGVHFGHQTQRWNPKMKPYVYTDRGGIHIIDLQKTVVKANHAAEFVKNLAANGGKIIFVGTKKQAIEPIQEAAQRCGQYFVTKRWLGGMLTNFETIKTSIDRLKRIDQMREKGDLTYLTKKERAKIEKEYLRLSEFLTGIREMKEAPSAMFVVDLPKEHIAVSEAKKLKMPVVGIADSNSDPESIDYPIPGNDDAIRSIKLFTNLIAESYMEGAKIWEEKARSQTDKHSDSEKETKTASTPSKEDKRRGRSAGAGAGASTKEAPKKTEGPSVVKVARPTRKLVAAGTAEEIEIQAELENPEQTTEPTEQE
ncbi:MAG TPA: 30S ribosomal protein S2 [Pseudobdellovibrionaceae bacterium]|nr:30S ribosomal protein S2 [Pseudobdellovibrionaceae bacterium]